MPRWRLGQGYGGSMPWTRPGTRFGGRGGFARTPMCHPYLLPALSLCLSRVACALPALRRRARPRALVDELPVARGPTVGARHLGRGRARWRSGEGQA
jgi:hypothetical protein